MHSSRMRTARFSGRLYREGGSVCLWVRGGCLPLGLVGGSASGSRGEGGVCLWVGGCFSLGSVGGLPLGSGWVYHTPLDMHPSWMHTPWMHSPPGHRPHTLDTHNLSSPPPPVNRMTNRQM